MADHDLGAYVWWRTNVRTPRWLDDNDWSRRPNLGHPVNRFWAWARSRGLIQVRPNESVRGDA